jgi:hypothetical protein
MAESSTPCSDRMRHAEVAALRAADQQTLLRQSRQRGTDRRAGHPQQRRDRDFLQMMRGRELPADDQAAQAIGDG